METDSSDDDVATCTDMVVFLDYVDIIPQRKIRDRTNPLNDFDDGEFRVKFEI